MDGYYIRYSMKVLSGGHHGGKRTHGKLQKECTLYKGQATEISLNRLHHTKTEEYSTQNNIFTGINNRSGGSTVGNNVLWNRTAMPIRPCYF